MKREVTTFIECVAVSMVETLALLEFGGGGFTESRTNAGASKNRTPNRIQSVQKDVPDES